MSKVENVVVDGNSTRCIYGSLHVSGKVVRAAVCVRVVSQFTVNLQIANGDDKPRAIWSMSTSVLSASRVNIETRALCELAT